MAEVNWNEIEVEYITTDISQRQLAKKYNVPLANITRRSTAENWVSRRQQHRDNVIAKTLAKTATQQSKELVKLANISGKATDILNDAFEDSSQFYRHLVEIKSDGFQEVEERIYDKIDSKALRDMTAILKELVAIQRDLFEIPTQAQRESQRVAAERLAMEKKKAALDDNADRKIEVVFVGGDVEKWSK